MNEISLLTFAIPTVESLTTALAVVVQPLWSVTVTVYVPAVRLLAVLPLDPLDHAAV